MTSTTHASSTAPKPVENAHKPNQANGRADADKPTTTSDLFSALLSLVSDTHATTATDELQDTAKTDADPTALNPLAAMLAWMVPGQSAADTDASARTAAKGTAATGADAPRAQGIDIDGMTRVDEAAPALPNAADKARSAAASRPAFSPFNPQAPSATSAASNASTRAADNATPINGGAPAMVWQRGGALGSTEALQQQQAAQLAQVRSTVALNERLGTVGVGDAAAPASLQEWAAQKTSGGAAATTGAAAGANTAVDGSHGVTASDSTGSNASDARGDGGAGDAQHPAEAGRQEAEATTVSHWGTQHLRHASLRVGGEGGADAIDIQLQVKGQEVQVAFQTDNAEARAHLRESAGESLADLMQRGGIQLGSVSVGSQGQAQSDTSRQPRPTGLSTEALGRTASAAEASRPLAQPRTDGSRPLDVFA